MDDIKLGRIAGTSEQLISYVKDRPTWFALCDWQQQYNIGVKASVTFEQVEKTVNCIYQSNLLNITSESTCYYEKQYN
jgi:dTDP-glucose 4,6-dehydratase